METYVYAPKSNSSDSSNSTVNTLDKQLKQGGGNIQTPPSVLNFCDVDTGFQCKSWFLTYHIQDNEQIKQAFENIKLGIVPLCSKYVFGEEYGKSGDTPHIQGCFVCHKKEYANKLAKFFKNGCTLVRLINWDGASLYCQKECQRILTNIEPLYVKHLILYSWQEHINKIIESEINDRDIHWFYESIGGLGKTSYQKYVYTHYERVIILSGKGDDMKNGVVSYLKESKKLPRIVLINIPRSKNNFISYSGIEEVKDMFFYSGKYEGGMICGPNPHVIVFSNYPPATDPETGEYLISKDRLLITKL